MTVVERYIFPLSFAQQRLWFIDQWAPGSPVYNMPATLRLHGYLDVMALEQGISEIVRRHETLRTTFTTKENQPVQVVTAASPASLQSWLHPIVDLRNLPADKQAQIVYQLLSTQMHQPFDLSCGPLLRTMLLRLKEQEHVFSLTIHHIISDAWSMGVLFNELASLYTAFVEHKRSPLPELPLQYADYAIWQRERLQGEYQRELLDYWQRQLSGAPELLELPLDRPRPAAQTFQGAVQRFGLPGSLADSLRALSRSVGATLFMTLLAAFQVLLARYSGQQDIVVGTAIANRPQSELERLIGLFVNVLALRLDVSGQPTFLEVLSRVRQVVLGAFAHEDLPFEKVVEAVAPRRNMNYSPVFQALFTLHNTPGSSFVLPGITSSVIPIDQKTAQFDLSLELTETSQGLVGFVEYNADIFDQATIERMIVHFQVLLQGIVAHPEQRIQFLPLLTATERYQLLIAWNDTKVEYDAAQLLHQLVEAQVARTPDAIALVFEDACLSYQQLDQLANHLAHALRSRLAPEHELIGICLHRCLDLLLGLLAILKAGCAYLPLDPDAPPQRLSFMLQQSQLPLLLTQQHLLPCLPEEPETSVLCFEELHPLLSDFPDTPPACPVLPQQLAYVIYTSGSTGTPKGAMLSHGGICNRLLWMQRAHELSPTDRVVQKTPYSFDVSLWELFWPLISGAALVLAPPGLHRESRSLLRLIQQQAITTVHFVPSMLSVLLSEPGLEACRALRQVMCSGEALPAELPPRFFARSQAALHNLYGPTEASVDVTSWHCEPSAERHSIPIGRPIANTQLYVLDPQYELVPLGVAGELYLAGVGLARGYLRQPALTAERFVPHPFASTPGERLYRTGDWVRYREDGALEFLGRLDQQVKLRGFRIELGEIEIALTGHPNVNEAVVLLREDQPGEKRLVAYVVPARAETFSAHDIRTYLLDHLPEYMIPSAFVCLSQLPVTTNGKLDRRALPAPEWNELANASYAEPVTAQEKTLARIWCSVLGLQQVGIHTSFFELGGDSILSLFVISRAREAGLLLTPKQMFQYQTIAGQAAIAENITSTHSETTEPPEAQGSVALAPIQLWFFEQELAERHHWNQATCLLATGTHLRPEIMQQAITFLIQRHEALRMYFTWDGRQWEAQISEKEAQYPSVISRLDVQNQRREEQTLAIKREAMRLQADFTLSTGPLLRALHVYFGPGQPDMLLLICHHLVIDGISWRILVEELQIIYQQLAQGKEIQLPPKATLYNVWAARLKDHASTPALNEEIAYWLAPARQDIPAVPLDYATALGANSEDSAHSIDISLTIEETKALLHDVPQTYHTHMHEVLLVALVQACAPWVGRNRLLVDLEMHGREDLFDDVDVSRTIGWFTSLFPLLLDLEPLSPSPAIAIDPGLAIKAIKEQVRSIPRHGIGYGALRYLSQDENLRSRLKALPQAQILFNYLGQFDSAQHTMEQQPFTSVTIDMGPLRGERNLRSHVLEINGLISGEQLKLNWAFSAHLHKQETIEVVAQRYLEKLRALIAHCRTPEESGYTPSDFTGQGLSQARLDKIMGKLRSSKNTRTHT